MSGHTSKETVVLLTASGISLVVGTLTGHILTKRSLTNMYESLISDEIAKAKAFYSQRNKTGDYSDPVALAEKLVGGDEDSAEPDDSFYEDGEGDPFANEPDDDHIVVDGKPFRETVNPSERVNYNKISEEYSGPVVKREEHVRKPLDIREGETIEEFEQRIIDSAKEEVEEIKDRAAENDPEYAEELRKEREEEPVVSNIFDTNSVDAIKVSNTVRDPGRPYIISVTEFTDNDLDYGQNTISYYAGDNVLADERDQPIPDIEGVVGMRNLRFGDGSGDPNIVFVRNDALEVDFEICQSLGTYAEEVLGVAPPESRSQRQR